MLKKIKSLFVEHDSMAKPLQKGKGIFIFCMVIVTILNFSVFYVAVNIKSLSLAFHEFVGNDQYIISTYQFQKFFSDVKLGLDGQIIPAFLNTMMYFWSDLLISLPLSFIISYFLFKKVFGYKFFRLIFFLPSILSSVVLVVIYKNILSQGSSLDFLLQDYLHLAPFKNFFETSADMNKMILIFQIWTSFGTNVILYQGAMKRVPDTVLEAAKLDGANLSTELFNIITPLVWPTVMTTITIAFSAFFVASGPIMLFNSGRDTNTYTLSFWLYWLVAGNNNSYEYAAAGSIIITILACPIAFTARGLLGKLFEPVEY